MVSKTTIVAMVRASEAPVQVFLGEHGAWAAHADALGLPLTNHWHQEHGRSTMKQKADPPLSTGKFAGQEEIR
jgi:hypothetical protein